VGALALRRGSSSCEQLAQHTHEQERQWAIKAADNYLCTGGGRKPPNRRESEIMLAIVVLLFVIAGLAAIYPG
jgi:hypothetical protein